MNRNTLVVKCVLLFIANSTDINYSGQYFCLWLIKNLRYYSSFFLSTYLFVGKMTLTALFWFLTYYSTPLPSLLQIIVLYLCHMQVYPSRNYIPAVISSSNYTSLSRSLTMDSILFSLFILFYFLCFLFLFLFIEQLRLGFISHAVTSVTNWWHSHKTDHEIWEKEVEGTKTKWRHTTWTTHVGLM